MDQELTPEVKPLNGYKKCKVCGAGCRLIADDGYYCSKHHPESKRKRSERQLKYYHTEKGLESYTKTYLKKKELKENNRKHA